VPLNDDILDRAIRHAHYIERLKNGLGRRVATLLDDHVLTDIAAKIEKRLQRILVRGYDTGPATSKRLKDLFAGLGKIIEGGMRPVGKKIKEELLAIAEHEAAWQIDAMKRALPIELEFTLPNPAQLRSIVTARPFEGEVWAKWWRQLSRRAVNGIRRQIQIGMVQGETVSQMTKRVIGTRAAKFRDGECARIRRGARATVRTAVNHVNTQSRETVFAENADIVKGVQIVATLDSKTSEICMAEDGKVYPLNEGPRPPFHWNCRTATTPVLRSWKELGIPVKEAPPAMRASMNGAVPAKTGYEGWLKRQPASVQREALGAGKYDLWKKEGVPLSRFVNDNRRVLTLDEIREREGIA
jgi:SPP1 gp7 family putative phage head morphogenesis protein